jgi:lipopolysaccharide transport system permease protein
MHSTTSARAPLPELSSNAEDASAFETERPQKPSFTLPENPLVTIEPSKAWVAVNLRDLWACRELLYFLIWRDLKVRYKQTALGVIWVVMQPLLTTIIFTVFLGRLARVPSDRVPYPLFVYAGLLPWTFFSSAVLSSGNSLVGNAHLITKVYFPRMIIPAATIGARLVDFGVAFIILAALMLFYGVAITSTIFILPLLLILITLFSLGLGLWTSALNVKYRDIGIALPVLIQLWMFVSPIVYPASLVPAQWRWLYALNPLVGIIENFRGSLFNREFNWLALAISTGTTIALLIYSAFSFRRMEKGFADLV